MEKRITYSEYNSVLCNCIRPIEVVPTDLVFSFEGYIKSQIYFPMLPYVDNRNLKDYLNAMDYLNLANRTIEFEEYKDSLTRVLRYFYKDLAVSINSSGIKFNYPDDYDFFVKSSDYPMFPVEDVSFSNTDGIVWKSKVEYLLRQSSQTVDAKIINMR